MIAPNVNVKPRELDIPDAMPLRATPRDLVSMTTPKSGCGMGLCGACTMHTDGQGTPSCIALRSMYAIVWAVIAHASA